MYISRNVIFHEHVLPYKSTNSSSSTSRSYFLSIIDKSTSIDQDHPNTSDPLNNNPTIFDQPDPVSTQTSHNSPTNDSPTYNTLPPTSRTAYQLITPTRASSRVRHHPSYLQDYICNSLATSTQSSKVSHTQPRTYVEASKHEF